MSNKYKSYSKVANARNYGYTPKQAMYEHNQEKAQSIDRSIVTKPGLKMYSDKQVAELSGNVVVDSVIPKRITWVMFKSFTTEEQAKYMDSIFNRYPSVPQSMIATMLGTAPSYLLNYLKKYFGDTYSAKKRQPVRDEEDIIRFKKEMMKGITPLGDKIENVVESPESTPKPTDSPVLGGVMRANLRCKAEDLPKLIAQLGMVGMVNVYVTSANYKRKDSDNDGLE